MRCVIYARYSSHQQREASIEDQTRICRARAEREGWDIIEVFADAAISGATMLRPGFQALLTAMERGAVDVVLTESLDRLSRDQEHIAGIYKRAIFRGVRLITLSEGEISELHVGLKGTMGALYLKDLADKTRRGIEGRVRKGRGVGCVVYGYRMVRGPLGPDGEFERGLREPNPPEVAIVQRVFAAYAAGVSPRAISKALNAEAHAGPGGGLWFDSTIRGRSGREDGLLRNRLYVGQLVWNRRRNLKDPVTGTTRPRRNPLSAVVVTEVPALRIIEDALWQRVQDRLSRESAPRGERGEVRFWEHRRPKTLVTGKVFCGCCGASFAAIGKDRLACRAARQGACVNKRAVRRSVLQGKVCEALATRLMDPDLAAEFATAFTKEWNRLAGEASAGRQARERELRDVERKISNIVDALAEGLRAAGVKDRLDALELKRAALTEALAGLGTPSIRLHPEVGRVYRDRMRRLNEALAVGASTEALEAARALIERIVVTPSPDGGPADIELIGELRAMLEIAGIDLPNANRSEAAPDMMAINAMLGSVKAGPGDHYPLVGGV